MSLSIRSVCWLTSLLLCFCGFNSCGGIDAGSEASRKSALEKGEAFLARIQRPDGAICDTVNPLFDTWETVLAASALYKINSDTNRPVLKKALAYLRANEDSAGMICHNKKCKDAFCLETTSEYFQLLIQIHGKEFIRPRLDTIIAMQKETGEWEIGNPDVRGQKDFPSVTAFVLNLFYAAKVEPRDRKKAEQWLVTHQLPEGHWGSNWEYYGSPAYAIWPMLRSLHHLDMDDSTDARKKAKSFVLESRLENNSWNAGDPMQRKKASAELQTAFMLCGILEGGSKDAALAAEPSVTWLLNQQQPDGSWNGGYFPIPSVRYEKKEYVTATALSLRAISQYKTYEERRR
jgi:Squalene-hopene cyclase C-terminal domain/Prenyltransferase and squalene oxidase repeat